MKDFKDAYQAAVQDMDMPGMSRVHIDVSQCMDEKRHRKRMVKQMRRTMTTTFSVACVVFVCGFGTVKATEYIGNVIRVTPFGFRSADAITMVHNEAGDEQIYIATDLAEQAMVEEAVKETVTETVKESEMMTEQKEPGSIASEADTKADKDNTVIIVPTENQTSGKEETVTLPEAEITTVQPQEMTDEETPQEMTSESVMVASGNREIETEENALAISELGTLQEQELGKSTLNPATGVTKTVQMEALGEVSTETVPVKTYTSWEEFYKNETLLFPQPSVKLGEMQESVEISVCDNWVMACYQVDGKVFVIERTDYTNTQGHTAAKVFPGGVCNERTYTTTTGYSCTLIDSVNSGKDESLQIHGAVTVGNYEAYLDFTGYTEEEAEKIIDSIEWSVYEQ